MLTNFHGKRENASERLKIRNGSEYQHSLPFDVYMQKKMNETRCSYSSAVTSLSIVK